MHLSKSPYWFGQPVRAQPASASSWPDPNAAHPCQPVRAVHTLGTSACPSFCCFSNISSSCAASSQARTFIASLMIGTSLTFFLALARLGNCAGTRVVAGGDGGGWTGGMGARVLSAQPSNNRETYATDTLL